ncbi:MAG: AAA family ATPase [Halomonas sp.]|nr:AAA family ATPase [Halomonas sp.]MDM7481624.1 AAA family ATPase [Halomonas sp.]
MSESATALLPSLSSQLLTWGLRLALHPWVQRRMRYNGLLFASWHAMFGQHLPWSGEAQQVLQTESQRKLTLERATSLLSKLNYRGASSTNLEQARHILAGYALQDWAVRSGRWEQELVPFWKEQLERFEELERVLGAEKAPDTTLEQLSQALELDAAQRCVLELALLCSALPEWAAFLNELLRQPDVQPLQLLAHMFALDEKRLRDALSARSALRQAHILRLDGGTALPKLGDFWVRLLLDSLQDITQQFYEPLSPAPSAGVMARLAPEDRQLAAEILRNGREPGINLLLHGAENLDKRRAMHELVTLSGRRGFRLKVDEAERADLPAMVYAAQRLLRQREGDDVVLLVERAGDVLDAGGVAAFLSFFGLEPEYQHIRPFDELLLSTNPIPCLWAGRGAQDLGEECVARFVFHAPLKKAKREDRLAQLREHLRGLALSDETQKVLLELQDVSVLQLESAARAARLSKVRGKKAREAYIVQAVKRSLGAMRRETAPAAKTCFTQYSLRYVNYAGRFGPEQILQALRLRPSGSLCLYGPPGTGKTQFVEYLAQQLDIRLMTRRASDLLSKYVGESEKNIAAMFEQARDEEAILFLDEGDSFLRDRTLAQHQWEVSQVNELLQHMERFEGIFVMATNLFRGLDAAALRRFTFKLELRALSAEQRWEMFCNEAHVVPEQLADDVRQQWWERLALMPQLTAGDFATVARQCHLLGQSLSPEQWLEQLALECAVKSGMPGDTR